MVTTFGRAGIDENNTLKKQTDTRNADVGFIKPFAGNTVPDGYLYCDGSAVSRTTYSELFAAIGTLYGAGDGSTTFNVPDLRGYFLRGDGGTNSAALGTAQTDAIRNITGYFLDYIFQPDAAIGGQYIQNGSGVFKRGNDISIYGSSLTINSSARQEPTPSVSDGMIFDASTVVPTAADNRPSNFSMKYCIGY